MKFLLGMQVIATERNLHTIMDLTGVRTKTWTPPGLRKELKNVFEEAGQ